MRKQSKGNFLGDGTLEENLRFVKNEAEEQLENFFAPVAELADDLSSGRSKIIRPSPGHCIKSYKKGTKDKFFINLCHTDAIPAPADITDAQLLDMLNEGVPGAFKIPMSITQPRKSKDRAEADCEVCDIAINSGFFKKIKAGGLMHDFLLTVMFEGIEQKHKIPLDETKLRVLQNKKVQGKLIKHNIQNRDVKRVIESYANPSADDLAKIKELDTSTPLLAGGTSKGKKLIEEIDSGTGTITTGKVERSVKEDTYVPDATKAAIAQAATRKPECKLFREPAVGKVNTLVAEFHLPDCISAKEITLDVGEDRILLEARKAGYLLDVFVSYRINDSKVQAQFNLETKILSVRLPVQG